MRRLLLSVGVALALAAPRAAFAADDIPTELTDYINAPDRSFAWKLESTAKTDAGTVYTIDLVSQTWHDIKWDHKLQIVVPKDAKPQATVLLWNQGGRPGATSGLLAMQIAQRVQAPVAAVSHVVQPRLLAPVTTKSFTSNFHSSFAKAWIASIARTRLLTIGNSSGHDASFVSR